MIKSLINASLILLYQVNFHSRFPSWESRIYQVASEGLAPHPTPDSSNNNTASRVHTSHGYCEISVPVYATVKGVGFDYSLHWFDFFLRDCIN